MEFNEYRRCERFLKDLQLEIGGTVKVDTEYFNKIGVFNFYHIPT